jgi:hypothetical protein
LEALQKQQLPAGQAAADNGLNEMQQAVLQAHCELFAMYKHRCRPLQAAAEDPYHHSCAVMHVSLARAEAVVLICLPGHAGSAAMAREVIERVDPSSQGVLMERFQSISLDVKLQDIVAHFGGVEEVRGQPAGCLCGFDEVHMYQRTRRPEAVEECAEHDWGHGHAAAVVC